MPITEVVGDLFSFQGVDALAHGCNCAGAMGAGIAVEFKRRWPEMYRAYRQECLSGRFRPGDVFTWPGDPTIFNLGTQASWKSGATLDAVQASLAAMAAEALRRNIKTIAMPRIAAGLGRLSWPDVLSAIEQGVGSRLGIIIASL